MSLQLINYHPICMIISSGFPEAIVGGRGRVREEEGRRVKERSGEGEEKGEIVSPKLLS